MKTLTALSAVLLLPLLAIVAQVHPDARRDYQWVIAYPGYDTSLPVGSNLLDFSQDPFVMNPVNSDLCFSYTNAGICDPGGRILAYSNGMSVYDRNHQKMPHGDSVNFGDIYLTHNYPVQTGYTLWSGAVLLPAPGDTSRLFLLHQKLEWALSVPGFLQIEGLYFSLIDLTQNQGMGDVIQKNQILIRDTLDAGIGCVRHANGRDWWILVAAFPTSAYYKLLLTPQGIFPAGYQKIGTSYPKLSCGNFIFSPDGNRMIRAGGTYFPTGWNRLEIFDFDRCTGDISLIADLSDFANDTSFSHYAAISPNSRYLYLTRWKYVYQYDLQAQDIGASKTTVAEWDGFIEPLWNLIPTYFGMSQLAPDGKIYISAEHHTQYIHYIDQPDEQGINCDVRQHAIVTPKLYGFSFPFMPNFRLGRMEGSVCDSLDWTGISDSGTDIIPDIKLSPNPVKEILTVELNAFSMANPKKIVVSNPLGQKIKEAYVAPFQNVIRLSVIDFPPGMYQLVLLDTHKMLASEKFLIIR